MAKKNLNPKRAKKSAVGGKPRRSTAAAAKSSAEGNLGEVTLRSPNGAIPLDAQNVNLAQEAMKWTYVVRSRRRWSDGGAAKIQEKLATDLLRKMGVDDQKLLGLARARIVEVSTRWTGQEKEGWPARILPWEYVITAATRDVRGDRPLTIVRHLNRGDAKVPQKPPQSVLFVASEPGRLRGQYSFDGERELVRKQFADAGAMWHQLESPSLADLDAAVREHKPDVVHLAGFDSHQALEVLRTAGRYDAVRPGKPTDLDFGIDENRDSYILAGPQGLEAVEPDALAKALTADGHRPQLVSLNIRNSAARIAPQIVAAGARTAVGFQDLFDDQLAEVFFSLFYGSLRRSNWNPNDAFQTAWETIRRQPERVTQGSGVVLWNAAPFVVMSPEDHARAHPDPLDLKPLYPGDVKPSEVRDWITVETRAFTELNYSLLHNKRSLFEKFQLFCPNQQRRLLRDVRIKVELAAGGERALYDNMFDVSSDWALDDIAVPLTSPLLRSIHETVRTSIFVEVSWGDHVIHRRTHNVLLVPVDLWRDTDDDRKWLPSFVFPRDPAVSGLVEMAQRHVRLLRDDPVSGFDGYQSIDPKDPESVSEVDFQVQAIWSAIVHELKLTYINPPPSYSVKRDSQRLRTPTMVVHRHSGTCIDLALFFAACLELVDIYPVIFLLEGHAFPGYWRSDSAHQRFLEARPSQIQEIVDADATTSAISGAQSEGWYLRKSAYDEIVQLVSNGDLVPLESVWLTENSGFWEAVEGGRKNFRPKRDFAAMIDIIVAREKLVTPLPIMGDQT
jgi:hypothetical protein